MLVIQETKAIIRRKNSLEIVSQKVNRECGTFKTGTSLTSTERLPYFSYHKDHLLGEVLEAYLYNLILNKGQDSDAGSGLRARGKENKGISRLRKRQR